MTAMTRRMFLMGGVSLFPYLYLERLAVAVRRYRVQVAGLPASFEGFTILHLSDLHEKRFGTGAEDLVRLIRHERFDIVAMTGDFVVGDDPVLTPALELISGIRSVADAPFYSVCGNHDWMLERGNELNERLASAGVRVISNRSAAIDRGRERLWILGVDDPVTHRDRLHQALRGTDRDRPRLLLSHSPHPFHQAVENGVDLMLAGHTHGGQVRLPLIGATFVPSMGFFPRFDYGMFRSRKTSLIVSGGLGESGLPIRFNIRPEVSLVTLVGSRGPRSAPQDAAG
jgi:uncharacterized protein